MSGTDNSNRRSDKRALEGPESGRTRPIDFEARIPDHAPAPSPARAEPKPLFLDLSLYGRWTGEEFGEVN